MLDYRYLSAAPSGGDLAYTMTSATFRSIEKNCLSQIECWNLENEAKTTRKIINLSVNIFWMRLAASCPRITL